MFTEISVQKKETTTVVSYPKNVFFDVLLYSINSRHPTRFKLSPISCVFRAKVLNKRINNTIVDGLRQLMHAERTTKVQSKQSQTHDKVYPLSKMNIVQRAFPSPPARSCLTRRKPQVAMPNSYVIHVRMDTS